MHDDFMHQAIAMAEQAVSQGTGGPFGAVVVHQSSWRLVGRGQNRVLSSNDPTAHAEVEAIRDACRSLQTYELNDYCIYTSCEPCPMCLGAIYWSRLNTVYYAANREDAAAIGFDDHFFYQEFGKHRSQRSIRMIEIHRNKALDVFARWQAVDGRQLY